jgi:hypothetical protein
MTDGANLTTHDAPLTYAVPLGVAPRRSRAQEAVARAMEAALPSTISRTERSARVAACREAVVAYAKSLRDEGLPVATVVADVKALVRGAPARSARMLRDALAGWTISAYYQAD